MYFNSQFEWTPTRERFFVFFLMRQNLKKINHSEGAENINFTY